MTEKANTKSFLASNRQKLQLSTLPFLLFSWVFPPFFRDFFSVFGLLTLVVVCTRETILNLDKEMRLIKQTVLI